jgi:hypothetical protein
MADSKQFSSQNTPASNELGLPFLGQKRGPLCSRLKLTQSFFPVRLALLARSPQLASDLGQSILTWTCVQMHFT